MKLLSEVLRPTKEVLCRVPSDALAVMMVALAMPILMLIYMVMPTLDAARTLFSTSLAVLATLIGALIQDRRHFLGYGVQCLAIAWCVMAVGVLWLLRAADADDQTVRFVWRGLAAAQQAWVVAAWGILAVIRHRWLSRRAARGAFCISAAGFVWFVYVNFQVPSPGTWHEWAELARGIGARAVSPWIEPLLWAAMWGWIGHCLLRWLHRHPDERGS